MFSCVQDTIDHRTSIQNLDFRWFMLSLHREAFGLFLSSLMGHVLVHRILTYLYAREGSLMDFVYITYAICLVL